MREKYSDACFSSSFGWPPFWSTDNSPRTRARTIDPRMIISSSVPSNAPPSLAKFFSVRRHKSIRAPLTLPLVLLLHRRSRFHLSLSLRASSRSHARHHGKVKRRRKEISTRIGQPIVRIVYYGFHLFRSLSRFPPFSPSFLFRPSASPQKVFSFEFGLRFNRTRNRIKDASKVWAFSFLFDPFCSLPQKVK